MAQAPLTIRRWNRAEYDRLVDLGVFDNEPLELIGGQLLDAESSPEPDVVVVPGRPADYRHAHPARPPLAIEVSDSSLAFDRQQKGSLFARAGLEDYWIVNLVDRVLEVHRDPAADASAVFGWRYRSIV